MPLDPEFRTAWELTNRMQQLATGNSSRDIICAVAVIAADVAMQHADPTDVLMKLFDMIQVAIRHIDEPELPH